MNRSSRPLRRSTLRWYPLAHTNAHSESGAALILVLGIIALLSIMVIAFLGTSSKQVVATAQSNTVFQEQKLAEVATSQFLADIYNEIRAGSVTPTSAGTYAIYYPATPLSAVPDRNTTVRVASSSGKPAVAPPNLLKQTASGQAFYDANVQVDTLAGVDPQLAFPQAATYPGSLRASTISTAPGKASASISSARWNKPLLLPRANPTTGDLFPAGYEPAASGSIPTLLAGQVVDQPWTWQPPDWVYLTTSGANPKTFSADLAFGKADAVVGRYAYQAYDIGGLLDLNVAGYSSGVATSKEASKKGSQGLADLTALGFTDAQLDALLKFRNPASYPAKTGDGGPYNNKYLNFLLRTPDPKSSTPWAGANGFMRVGGLSSGISNHAFPSRQAMTAFLLGGFGSGTQPSASEQATFIEALQSLTHFSRSLEQPSYKPGFYLADASGTRTRSNSVLTGGTPPASTATSPAFIRPSIVPPKDKIDDILYPITVANNIPASGNAWSASTMSSDYALYKLPYEEALGNNRGGNDMWGTIDERTNGKVPGFPLKSSNPIAPAQRTVTTPLQDVVNPAFLEVRVSKPFQRFDGTTAVVGEPLVKKRFPLERLAWLTPQGPSADLPSSSAQYNSLGTKNNIKAAFGLTWHPAGENSTDVESSGFWGYDHGKTGYIYTLDELADVNVAAPREPDFFELLYATVNVGSVGKSALQDHPEGVPFDPTTYQQVRDRTSRFQIMEIGANIIDQYDTDSFPTIIKLPNTDTSVSAAQQYYPALFTARGVEDLPYFYRLHWRAFRNKNQTLMPSPDEDPNNDGSPGDAGPKEITHLIGTSPYDSTYKSGVVSLVAFPEMWNPHSSGLKSSVDGPTKFRVLAASQTPNDILVANSPLTFTGSYVPYDKGLQNNPKLWDATTPPSQDKYKVWASTNSNSAIYQNFMARVHGGFYALDRNPMNVNTTDMASFMKYEAYPADVGAQIVNTGSPTSTTSFNNFTSRGSIFWENSPLPSKTAGSSDALSAGTYLITNVTEYAFPNVPSFLSASDLSLIGAVIDPGSFTTSFSISLIAGGTLVTTPPLLPASYEQYNFLSAAQLNPTATTTPKPTATNLLDSAKWFMLKPAEPTAPAHFGVNYPCYVSLTNSAVSKVGAQPRHGLPLSTSSNTWVDYRGTDLLFDLGLNSSLFREPTSLCNLGTPSGTVLRFGSGNFFSGAPYSGNVQSDSGNWVGFSLGETPSQYVAAYRFDGCKYVSSAINPLTGGPFTDIYGTPITGLVRSGTITQMVQSPQNQDLQFTGYNVVSAGTGGSAFYGFPISTTGTYSTTPTRPGIAQNFGGVTAGLPYVFFRYLSIPVNVVNLTKDQYLTLQCQFQNATGQWVTYDERYLKIPSSVVPVLSKQQITATKIGTQLGYSSSPVGYYPQTGNIAGTSITIQQPIWRPVTPESGLNFNNQMAFGYPMVCSFDPRSSRFGHPARNYNVSQVAINGSRLIDRYSVNPNSWTSTGLSLYGDSNPTDRGTSTIVDDFTSSALPSSPPPTLVSPSLNCPAGWNGWIWKSPVGAWVLGKYITSYAYSYDINYYGVVQDPAHDVSGYYAKPIPLPYYAPVSPSWWASGKFAGTALIRRPALYSNDYGWFAHAVNPKKGDPLSSLSTPGSQVASGPPTSANANLPYISSFYGQRQWGTSGGLNYAADSLRIGLFSENIQPKYQTDDPSNPLYSATYSEFRQAYADCDDVVRRAMGAFAPISGFSTTLDGLPQGQATSSASLNQDNRPIVLNRPFRSVAELGYVFRGSPWKNLNFSTPETGDAALLDVFCLSEPPPVASTATSAVSTAAGTVATSPLVAGKVNLNTRQEPVLKAIIAGALKDEVKSTVASSQITAETTTAAETLIGRTMGTKAWLGPLANVSELAGKLFGKDISNTNFNMATDPIYTSTVYKTTDERGEPNRSSDISTSKSTLDWHFTGFSADLDNVFTTAKDRKNLRMREAIIRALADSGQTRVWNIMLDLIVQTGRLPATASDLKQFNKEGEHRVWVYLAIDRLTGEVLDQQVEDVTE